VTAARPLREGVADLRRHLGSHRPYQRAVVLDGLAISTASVPEGAEVVVDLELESISNGLVAHGTIAVPWEGACRRCLEPVAGVATADVREIFERHPTEGETYPLADEVVDLEPMVRDAALLALPLAPLCADGCLGPSPDAFPTGPAAGSTELADQGPAETTEPVPDPRWAALADLRFDSTPDDDAS
jgi:uncharacterized protein